MRSLTERRYLFRWMRDRIRQARRTLTWRRERFRLMGVSKGRLA